MGLALVLGGRRWIRAATDGWSGGFSEKSPADLGEGLLVEFLHLGDPFGLASVDELLVEDVLHQIDVDDGGIDLLWSRRVEPRGSGEFDDCVEGSPHHLAFLARVVDEERIDALFADSVEVDRTDGFFELFRPGLGVLLPEFQGPRFPSLGDFQAEEREEDEAESPENEEVGSGDRDHWAPPCLVEPVKNLY